MIIWPLLLCICILLMGYFGGLVWESNSFSECFLGSCMCVAHVVKCNCRNP